MSKKLHLLEAKMGSSRNIRETPRLLSRETSFKKKESSSPTGKNINEHLKLMIEGTNSYSKEEIFSEIIKILKKPQTERNALDIKFLIFATSNIKFFQKTALEMGAKTYEKICNFIEYSHYNAGDVIFNLGLY